MYRFLLLIAFLLNFISVQSKNNTFIYKDVFKFQLPNSLEIVYNNEVKKKDIQENGNNILVSESLNDSCFINFQERGFDYRNGFERKCEVMVYITYCEKGYVYPGKYDELTITDKYWDDRLSSWKNIYKPTYKILKELDHGTMKINNFPCEYISFLRTGYNGEANVIVNEYEIFGGNKKCIIEISYKESGERNWAWIKKLIQSSFTFTDSYDEEKNINEKDTFVFSSEKEKAEIESDIITEDSVNYYSNEASSDSTAQNTSSFIVLLFFTLLILTIIVYCIKHRKHKKGFYKAYEELEPLAIRITDSLHYWTGSEKDYFLELAKANNYKFFYQKGLKTYVKENKNVETKSKLVNDIIENAEKLRTEHNKKTLKNLEDKYCIYLKNRLDYPLDEQQRKAILTDEDNTLVISSAGSGKTSTIVGKTNYLIERLKVDPKRILLITFTKKAARDLSARLNIKGLECKTFHKVARDIIAHHNGKQPNYADDLNFQVQDAFREMLYGNKEFRKNLTDFMLFYLDSEEQHSYDSSEKYFEDRNANGNQTLVPDYECIKKTKSNQEKRIFHYLYTLGLNFTYERPYDEDTRDLQHRQYKPDFTISYKVNNKIHYLYFEHFAINKHGETPSWFEDGGDYIEGMEWKKGLHQAQGTNLVYTTSGDFEDGSWQSKIDKFLKEYGIKVSPRSQEDIENAIDFNKKNRTKPISDLISSFINLMKAGNYDLKKIKDEIKESKDEKNEIILINLIEPVYDYYQKRLADMDAIDFSDSIKLATQICNEGFKETYDYILVDEFQDISMDRYEFLQSLRRANPLTKLFCVGDDWQSIYRFAGSDMALFYDFAKFFGYAEEQKIERTYRFGQPLISLSSEFIQKNPNQKRKDVIAGNESAKTEFDFIEYETNDEDKSKEYEEVEKIVKSLPLDASVFILARYSFSDDGFPKRNRIEENGKVYYDIASHRCAFLTAHSSKGLEADYVIIIGCTSGVYGFPSRVANHKILSYVMSKSDDYTYSEDRRLFYVAMTRAKRKTFFVYPSNQKSEFIRELNNVEGEGDTCPYCKIGKMVLHKSGTSKYGNKWSLYYCNNYMARCPHSQMIWENKNLRHYREDGSCILISKEEYDKGNIVITGIVNSNNSNDQ